MIKRIFALAAAMVLAAALCLPALAAEMDYTGEIDSFTGQAAAPSRGDAADTAEGRTQLSSGVAYDWDKHAFAYTLPGGAQLFSSVADGMMTTDAVSLNPPSTLEVLVYRDGEEVPAAELSSLTRPGSYAVSAINGGQRVQVLSFTILNRVTGAISVYNIPEGFVATEATFNGDAMLYTYGAVPMEQEGKYAVRTLCMDTGITYGLTVEIDHTAPVLALTNVVDGVAKGPVDLSDLEKGAAMLIQLDGKTIPNRSLLTDSGRYTVIVQDEAGNTSYYNFHIQVYFNVSAWVFLTLAVLLLGGVGVYITLSRARMRTY